MRKCVIFEPPKFAFCRKTVDSVEKLFRVFWEMDLKLQIAVKMCNLRVTRKFAFLGARFCLIRFLGYLGDRPQVANCRENV